MLAYASENFNEELPNVVPAITVEGISGKHRVRVWCIDEMHTNPYALSLRENIGTDPTAEQIERMREEGSLKPVNEYDQNFDIDKDVKIELTNNALALIEIE
jgi:hypothetical protein